MTLVLLWFKNKQTKIQNTKNVLPCIRYTGFLIEFVSIWKHAVQLFLLSSCLSFELGATLFRSIRLLVPCMILVLSYILHDRLWCGFILCLTCTLKQNVFIPFHFLNLLLRPFWYENQSYYIKTSWRISDGYGFRFPLFIVILCLYERPVLNGLCIWGGKRSSDFTTSLFSDVHEFVTHLSDAWLHLLLSNSPHLKKGVFSSSAWNWWFHFSRIF